MACYLKEEIGQVEKHLSLCDRCKEIVEVTKKIKEMEKELEELIHTTHVASINYEIWWVYNNKEDRSKYLNIMNKYSEFFSASIHAHFVAMLMALSKLYENRNNTVNINKFLISIRNKQFIDEVILVEVEQSLKNKKDLIEKICILRNNYFAHISNKLDYDEVLDKANIKYKNFRELIDLAYDLLKKISHAYNRGDVSPRRFSREDVLRLLNNLRGNIEDN